MFICVCVCVCVCMKGSCECYKISCLKSASVCVCVCLFVCVCVCVYVCKCERERDTTWRKWNPCKSVLSKFFLHQFSFIFSFVHFSRNHHYLTLNKTKPFFPSCLEDFYFLPLFKNNNYTLEKIFSIWFKQKHFYLFFNQQKGPSLTCKYVNVSFKRIPIPVQAS